MPLFLSDVSPSAELLVRLEAHQIDHVDLGEIKTPLRSIYLLLFIMKVYTPVSLIWLIYKCDRIRLIIYYQG